MPRCPTCQRELDRDARYCPFDRTELVCRRAIGGRYRVVSELGSGACGVVYRARDEELTRDVAIKILRQHLCSDAEIAERFRREARAVASLRHPGIVELYDVGEEEGAPFFVMEWIDGWPLDELVRREGPMSVERAVSLARQIASALDAAHRDGIVHRDLKPANVLVSQRSGRECAKLVDFGLVKLLDRGSERRASQALTRAGALYGTPEYMAPEQVLGETVDPRTDLYALGVMLFALTTGELPYDASGIAVLVAHLEADVPDPRERNAAVPPALSAIIQRLMAKRRSERFASAAELIVALDAVSRATAQGPELSPSASAVLSLAAAERAPAQMADFSQPPSSGRGRWAAAALLSCVVVGVFATVGAVRGRPAIAEPSAALRPVRGQEPRPSGVVPTGPRRAIVATAGELSVRVLVPERPATDEVAHVTVDVWDGHGRPAQRAVLFELSGADLRRSGAAIETDMPGRYRIDQSFERAGRHELVLQVGDSVWMTIELSVLDESTKS